MRWDTSKERQTEINRKAGKRTRFTRLVVQGSGLWSLVKMNLMVYGLDLTSVLQLTDIFLLIALQFSLQRSSPWRSALAQSNRRLLEFEEKSRHQSLWHFFKCEQILSGGTVREEIRPVISARACSGLDVCNATSSFQSKNVKLCSGQWRFKIHNWRSTCHIELLDDVFFWQRKKKCESSVPAWWMAKNICCNILQIL